MSVRRQILSMTEEGFKFSLKYWSLKHKKIDALQYLIDNLIILEVILGSFKNIG